MRNMSFSKTLPQMRRREKTVTRRTGWKFLSAGDHVRPVEKAMGLKRGEKVQPIFDDGTVMRIVDVRREPIGALDPAEQIGLSGNRPPLADVHYTDHGASLEATAEGFPEMSGAEFVEFFCREMRCKPDTEVTRIEFEFVPDPEVAR